MLIFLTFSIFVQSNQPLSIRKKGDINLAGLGVSLATFPIFFVLAFCRADAVKEITLGDNTLSIPGILFLRTCCRLCPLGTNRARGDVSLLLEVNMRTMCSLCHVPSRRCVMGYTPVKPSSLSTYPGGRRRCWDNSIFYMNSKGTVFRYNKLAV
mmetsp:Transcript_39712/g.93017  ORF Transcript_39712/g.93017 Transcript_39712/m.93017 type:complete len:154 (+) Transcript_39712:1833-2294(+)